MIIPSRLPAFVVGAALTLAGCSSTNSTGHAGTTDRAFHEAPRQRAEAAAPVSEVALDASAGLDEYVAFGLAKSAEIRAAFEEWSALTERASRAGTLPDPQFTFAEFLEEVQTRTGPQRRRFGISQAFPWPGKLGAQEAVAERQAEAAWQRVEMERLRVVSAIEIAFHEYAFLAMELEITRELQGLLVGLESIVQSRVRAGAGQADLLRLQVEIGRVEDSLAGFERRRPSLSARLSHAMNSPIGTEPLQLPALQEPETVTLDTEALHRVAQESSPALRELEQAVAASREARDLAGYEGRPDFRVGLDYIQTGDARAPGTPGSGDDPVILGVSMSLPVWGSSNSAAEREAEHRVRAFGLKLEAAQSKLRADVEHEAYRVEDAARRIGLYRDSLIPRAREALDLTLTSYRAGDASVLDLIDSERATLEFELSLWRACREYFQGQARLKALTGGGSR